MSGRYDPTEATGFDLPRPQQQRSLDTVDAADEASLLNSPTMTADRIAKPSTGTTTGRGSSRTRDIGPLELGTRVGDYILEEKLGAGGMGEVFAARHVETGELIALKTLSSTTATRLYRFKREFRALADVSHRNLIQLHELVVPDVGLLSTSGDSLSGFGDPREGALAFFTMELLDGEPFVEWVRQDTPDGELPDLARLELGFRQLIDGIVHLHAQDCIHRDLKPSNVLVTRDDRVVVLDFGLVSELSAPDKGITRDGQLLGTPSYMAPEQALGERVTVATDYYALGVMLYQCLTGALPHRGSMMQQLVDKQTGPIPDPRDEVEGIPDQLGSLCVRLLARDPDDRPSSQQLADFARASRSTANEIAQVFVGRKQELASLHDALARVKDKGEAAIVHLCGPSGSGKSTLIRKLRTELPEDEVTVLTGRCREREAVPYKGVDALIDSLSAYIRHLPNDVRLRLRPNDLDALGRVFPVLDEIWDLSSEQILGLNEARALGWTTLRKLLERLAAREPLVLHIDDFQWADLDSVQLLESLMRPPGEPRIVLLISYRSDIEPTPALRELLDNEVLSKGPQVIEHELPPLTTDEAQALAEALLATRKQRGDAQAVTARATAIALRSSGNPLFVAQMALAGDAAMTGDADLDQLFGRQVTELDAASQRLLEVIAVYGGPMPTFLALDISEGAKQGMLDALVDRGLLVRELGKLDREARVEVAHDRVRTLVLARMSDDRRVAVHRQIGTLLLELHTSAPDGDTLYTVVNHLNAGIGDRDALERVRRLELARLNYEAGRRALDGTAWVTARDYLEQAYDLLGPWMDDARAGRGEHALCLDVAFARAQAVISLQDPDGDALIEELLGWQLSESDYCRVAHWYAWNLFPTTRWDDCVDFGLRVLPRMGFRLSRRTSWLGALLTYMFGYRKLMRLGVDKVHALPAIADQRTNAALDIILIVCAQARATDFKLHLRLMGTHARLLAKHGFHDGAGVAIANLAMSAAILGNAERAQELCRYAKALPEHRSVSILAQSAAQSIEVWTIPMFMPARAALELTDQIYARLCEVAPMSQVGAVTIARAFTQMLAGVPLSEAKSFMDLDADRHEGAFIPVVEGVCTVVRRCIDALIHGPSHATLGDDVDGLNEYYKDTIVPVFDALLATCLGDHAGGLRFANKLSRGDERKIGPIWIAPTHALVSTICATERFAEADSAERRRLQRTARRHRKTVASWAGRSESYKPMLHIVDGEIASRKAQHDAAVNAFEQARAAAVAGKQTWLSALASERLAAAAKRRGHLTLAETAIRNARDAYAEWGAHAAVRRFEA